MKVKIGNKNVDPETMDDLCRHLHALIYDFRMTLFLWGHIGDNASKVNNGGRGKTFWANLQRVARDMMVLTICKIYGDYLNIIKNRFLGVPEANKLFVGMNELANCLDYKALSNFRNKRIGHLKPEKPGESSFWIPSFEKLSFFLQTAEQFLTDIRNFLGSAGDKQVCYCFESDVSQFQVATGYVFDLWLKNRNVS
jgi:hypothetical protein